MDSNLAEYGLEEITSQTRLATMVWEMLQKTITVPDIANAVAAEFGMPRDRALRDTRLYVEYFSQADFDCRRF